MVGVFYRAPEPGKPPFVEVGDVVAPGQTLCMLEAMKLFNELKADAGGRVTAIHVENGKPVEFGQLLFELEPIVAPPDALMFSRVLVANRGEIAVRVIRALHELGAEAVAVYSTADADALHVRLADRAVRIGPPSASESYLRIPSVIAAAETTGCEAVHPGYGFLSENPAFVRACEDNDLVFVGPGADVMERMGDKAQAKAEMKAAGVPLVPGTEGGATLAEVRAAASELGFPVLLKAVSGGGGKGMRLVHGPDELEAAYSTARAEAEAAFSDGVALPREGARARAARRDPGALRQGRRRAHARRARVLDPAPPPEADRGVAVAGARPGDARGDGGGGRARLPHDRLRERRHVRVPARRRRHLPLHRAERPPAGRASRQRARDRGRHRPRAAADRGGRAARR